MAGFTCTLFALHVMELPVPAEPVLPELEWASHPRPTSRESARAVGVVWVLTTALASLLYLGIWKPQPAFDSLRQYPKGFPAFVMIAIAAFGVALVLGLLWVNRRRLKPLFRVTGGKIIAMILLAMAVPVDFFGPIPVSIVLMVTEIGALSLLEMLAMPAALAMGYVAGAAIIHGIRNRALRGFALIAFAMAEVSAIALLIGLNFDFR